MRAISDGPADAGRRLHRYWYRESRCQVRTGWQKKSAQSVKSVAVFLRALRAFVVKFNNLCVLSGNILFCVNLGKIFAVFRPKVQVVVDKNPKI